MITRVGELVFPSKIQLEMWSSFAEQVYIPKCNDILMVMATLANQPEWNMGHLYVGPSGVRALPLPNPSLTLEVIFLCSTKQNPGKRHKIVVGPDLGDIGLHSWFIVQRLLSNSVHNPYFPVG